ncbi:ABC transporter permease [Aneurinibacillus migulanus]|uniref:ABC transporter permease n=1 Tax=Aneurinibacillus migulanus TaxID=47500 RepID=UPI002E1B77B4|nr:ABC transporter permease [Aneurinibacillus migulanus]
MTLFSLARRNIRRNFYNYFLYFASMIFSIVIYFTFVSLQYNEQVLSMTASSTKIGTVFNGASVVLMIFVAIFIWYSNSFFTRKRKKEVGLYSLLGVRKKEIGRMLFYENFVMGLLALAVGIFIGTLLSKLFVMLLMKLMGFHIAIAFVIAPKAIINTVFVFMVIILFTSLQGYRLIYRFKLIELFQAEKKGETAPRASFFVALLAVVSIGTGYWIALQNITSAVWIGHFTRNVVIIFSGVIIGTYFLFNSLAVFLLKLSKKNKKRYYDGMNMVGTSQLLYRIRGNARTLSIISLLSAVTLCAIGTSYSFYYKNEEWAKHVEPFSYAYISGDKQVDEKVKETISQTPGHSIISDVTVDVVKVKGNLDNLDRMIPSAFMADEDRLTLLSESSFNQLIKEMGKSDTVHLTDMNEAVAIDGEYTESLSSHYKGKTALFETKQGTKKLIFSDYKTYFVMNARLAGFTVVVSDESFNQVSKTEKVQTIQMYNVQDEKHAEQLTEKMQQLVPETAQLDSFYATYKAGMEAKGMLIFMGAFLGLVFLLATGSVIYFKQLTEATADRERYVILQKIGVKKKEIKASIAKQIFFVFAMPLVIGIAHSTVALTALSNLAGLDLAMPVFISMCVYTVIYTIYYFLTVSSYSKIVMEQP